MSGDEVDWEIWTDGSWESSCQAAAQMGDVERLTQTSVEETIARNSRGWSAVMYASAAEDMSVLQALLKREGADEALHEARLQALVTAVHCSNLNLVNFLYQHDLVTDDDLDTGLLQATALNHAEVARLLLALGANPDTTDESGSSVLQLAAALGHEQVHSVLESAVEVRRASLAATSSVRAFCVELAARLETYRGVTVLVRFLEAACVAELAPLMVDEEVDLGVCLGMSDLDLQSIGVTCPETRDKLLAAAATVKEYFESLFGEGATTKLF